MEGTQEGGKVRAHPGRGGGGGGRVRSEYSSLVLSADGALGFLGVHEPCGAGLSLRPRLLVHHVPL